MNCSRLTRGSVSSREWSLSHSGCLARSLPTSSCVRSLANTPVSVWPSMVLVVMRSLNSSSALVELDSQGEWRQMGTRSLVSTTSHSMKSAPCATASVYASAVCSGSFADAPRWPTTSGRHGCDPSGSWMLAGAAGSRPPSSAGFSLAATALALSGVLVLVGAADAGADPVPAPAPAAGMLLSWAVEGVAAAGAAAAAVLVAAAAAPSPAVLLAVGVAAAAAAPWWPVVCGPCPVQPPSLPACCLPLWCLTRWLPCWPAEGAGPLLAAAGVPDGAPAGVAAAPAEGVALAALPAPAGPPAAAVALLLSAGTCSDPCVWLPVELTKAWSEC
mmetsp:Transcript_28967/g.73963  ORF Transcript_28967/g.73963 Transcript_28967/m.73963 type:complete len:330 (-) Transcript_28967:263-1252(-)